VITGLVLGSAFLTLLAVAVRDDRDGRMTLGFLRPLVEVIIEAGRWMSIFGQNHLLLAGAIGAIPAVGWALWHARSGHRFRALLAVSGAVALAAEALVVGDRPLVACVLFGGSFVLAMWAGRIGDSRPIIGESGITSTGDWAPTGRLDILAVAALTLLTMLYGFNAVNQHPQYFFHEQIPHFIHATSLWGVKEYMIGGGFYGNAPGAVHVLVMYCLGLFLGGSLLTVRVTAVLGAVVTVPVFHLFVRRYFGTVAALVATTLMVTSPTHIWFGRTDDNFFIYVPLLAVVMAWSTRRALETGGGLRWTLVVALMFLSRFVYAAGQLGWMLPVGLVVHALVFGRPTDPCDENPESRGGAGIQPRRPWAGLAAVVVGVLLWTFSVSIVLGLLRGDVRWISPLMTHGVAAWDASEAGASLWDKANLSIGVMLGNLRRLGMGLFWNTSYGELFWYRWSQLPHRSVWLVSAAAALVIPACGLVVGRVRRSRSAMLVVWMAVAIIPGCLSSGLGVRRVLMLFPALYAVIGFYLAAVLGPAAAPQASLVRRIGIGAVTVFVLVNSIVGLNSGLNAPAHTPGMLRHARFLGPVFKRHDLIIHALDPRHESTIVYFSHRLFDDPDRLIAVQNEPRERWPDAVLNPEFRADSGFYRHLGFQEQAERLARSHQPESVAIVVHDVPENQRSKVFLGELFKDGVISSCCSDLPGAGLWVIELAIGQIEEAARPEGRWNSRRFEELFSRALPGVRVNVRRDPDAADPIILGGLKVPESGWYYLNWDPRCGAGVEVDGRAVAAETPVSLVEGVHGFSVEIADVEGCEDGLDMVWSRYPEREPTSLTNTELWGPRVASVAARRLEKVTPFAGHGERVAFVSGLPGVWDMAGLPEKGLAVLCVNLGVWTVHRYDPVGSDLGSWKVPVGPQPHGMRISLGDSGDVAVLGSDELFVFSPGGERAQSSLDIGRGLFTDVVYGDGGDLWMSHFDRRVILQASAGAGSVTAHELHFIGGNEGQRPTGLDLDPVGNLVVLYENGLVQIAHIDPAKGSLALSRSFHLGYEKRPEFIRLAIPSTGWFHTTFRPASGWLSYDGQGIRRMAATPERGLFGPDIERASVIAAVGDDLFVHDEETGIIWRIAPLGIGE
jgi:hypothetical protein